MIIEWAVRARLNLREIYQYIADDSPQNAGRFILKLFDSVDNLAHLPEMGRRVPEARQARRQDVRELIVQDYRIMYIVKPERVLILNVIHGSRELGRMNAKPWDEV